MMRRFEKIVMPLTYKPDHGDHPRGEFDAKSEHASPKTGLPPSLDYLEGVVDCGYLRTRGSNTSPCRNNELEGSGGTAVVHQVSAPSPCDRLVIAPQGAITESSSVTLTWYLKG